MKILISLPIYKRDWILPLWLKSIENQTVPLNDIGFQFELGPNDDSTHEILWSWHAEHPEVWCFDLQIEISENHKHHLEGQRAWLREEYLRMVTFRNNLLDRACLKLGQFDRYFSLDSDVILENPNTLSQLASHNKDVVSPLMFMTYLKSDLEKEYDIRYPNSMNFDTQRSGLAIRNELSTGLQKIDVPMAAVMMKPEVVKNTRYQWHRQGEDIGFAVALRKLGFESYIDYDIYTPHIMHRAQLEDYLKNGDPRGSRITI